VKLANKRMSHRIVCFLPGFRSGLAGVALCCLLLFSPRGFPAMPGADAPDFSLPALETDGEISLEDFRGKVIYLDFWASWCGPCRKSLPLYEQMKKSFPPDRFEIIAINLDEDRNDAARFLEKHPVSYTMLWDPAGITARLWQVQAMPSSFLLDSNGRTIKSWAGFYPSHLEEIQNEILSALQ
jgi:thiol-disulfide isomerase/thioredoxin